jgi:hypothetical protein
MKNKGYKSHRNPDGSRKDESVAPGYLPSQGPTNNGERPDGRLDVRGPEVPHASLALQDLHRRLGSALPELHGLVVTTITDERTALAQIFNELHTGHCDIGNVLSYTNQIPDQQMNEMVGHYTAVVSQMLGALNPYLAKNPAVAHGPYHLGGPLSEDHLSDDQSWFRPTNDPLGHDWSSGLAKPGKSLVGSLAKVNSPGHAFHGMTVRALRPHGSQIFAEPVDRPGKGDYFGRDELHPVGESVDEDQDWYRPTNEPTGRDWSFGLGKPGGIAQGNWVQVNDPTHERHGQVGRITRQQSRHFHVAFPGEGKGDFFHAGQLKPAEAPAGGGRAS